MHMPYKNAKRSYHMSFYMYAQTFLHITFTSLYAAISKSVGMKWYLGLKFKCIGWLMHRQSGGIKNPWAHSHAPPPHPTHMCCFNLPSMPKIPARSLIERNHLHILCTMWWLGRRASARSSAPEIDGMSGSGVNHFLLDLQWQVTKL